MTQPTDTPSHDRCFAGLKVLDASQGLAGPYCAMLLAQHGAQVIKLEPPDGDWSRGIGTLYDGTHTALSLAANRGKRSLALDLKQPAALDAVLRIADQCDVMLESFRPGVADKLGIGYAQVSARNPRLLYLSVSGFGQQGPYSRRPGADTVIQAFSGLVSLNRGADGKPSRVGCLMVDTATGLYAFQALSAALYARQMGAGGRHLDVNLMQATAAFLAPKIIEAALEGEAPRKLNVPAGVYQTSDGWLALTMTKEESFGALCRVMQRPDLAGDPRFANFALRADHQDELVAQVAASFAQQPNGYWLERLAAADVMASQINRISDWLADPHVQAVDAAPRVAAPGAGQIPLSRIPGTSQPTADDPRCHFADIGQDNLQVLRDCGFSAQEIAALDAAGAMPRATTRP